MAAGPASRRPRVREAPGADAPGRRATKAYALLHLAGWPRRSRGQALDQLSRDRTEHLKRCHLVGPDLRRTAAVQHAQGLLQPGSALRVAGALQRAADPAVQDAHGQISRERHQRVRRHCAVEQDGVVGAAEQRRGQGVRMLAVRGTNASSERHTRGVVVSEPIQRDETVTSSAPSRSNGPAIASLVTGIIALLLSWIPGINLLAVLLAVVALVTGFIGLRNAKVPGTGGKGMAITGLVTGVLAILLTILVYAGLAAVFNDPEVQQQLDEIEQEAESEG